MRGLIPMRWLHLAQRLRGRLLRQVTVGVRVALVRDGEAGPEVLLVRHTYMRGWFFPGGGVKRRESLEDAARREAREETGARIETLELAGVYHNTREGRSDHVVLFTATAFAVDGAQSREIAEARFFPLDDLPPDTNAGTLRRIDELRDGAGVPRFGRW